MLIIASPSRILGLSFSVNLNLLGENSMFQLTLSRLDNMDNIFGEAEKESFEKAYELEMYFDAPEDALADSVDYISYFGFEVRDSCDFVFSVKRFQDLEIPDPNRTDARLLETPLEGD